MMELFYKLVGVASAVAEEAAAAAGTTATAATATAEEVAEINPVVSIITTLLPMVLIFVVFYFMLIRTGCWQSEHDNGDRTLGYQKRRGSHNRK